MIVYGSTTPTWAKLAWKTLVVSAHECSSPIGLQKMKCSTTDGVDLLIVVDVCGITSILNISN